jgi:hypothetical protein
MRERFWGIVQDELAAERFGIQAGCEDLLSGVIEGAVHSIRSQTQSTVPGTGAEDDFRWLVRQMIALAKARGYHECHEGTLIESLAARGANLGSPWPLGPLSLHPPDPWPKTSSVP